MLSQVREFMYLEVLFMSEVRVAHETDRSMQLQSVVAKFF